MQIDLDRERMAIPSPALGFCACKNDSASIEGQNIGPTGDSPEIQALYQALEGLRQSAKIRIWPLYTEATTSDVAIIHARRLLLVVPLRLRCQLNSTHVMVAEARGSKRIRGGE